MSSIDFSNFALHPDILSSITALGYKTPTPIQQQSIPPILLGQDVIGLAQTGTGKTAAFVLPMLQRLMQGKRGSIRGLIICPTRELAEQIHDAIGKLAKGLNIRSVTLYGGVALMPQIKKLRRGADIAVVCPGRLLDHLRQHTIDLSAVEMLVLDEADHMFDVGFLPNIRQILKQLPSKRQSLLFSATMPAEVRQLAHDILRQPVTVQISNTVPAKSVAQALYPIPQHLKADLLIHLLQSQHIFSALVFTRTKHRAKRLAEQLADAGYSTTSLQGNLSQNKRQAALNAFRQGKLQILVATDIASRGIDIAHISHVINFDMPETVEAYTHRIGRTGRAAKLGDAFTLVTREDSEKIRRLERVLQTKLERRLLPDFDYQGEVLPHFDTESTQRPARSRQRRSSHRHTEHNSRRDTDGHKSPRKRNRSRTKHADEKYQSRSEKSEKHTERKPTKKRNSHNSPKNTTRESFKSSRKTKNSRSDSKRTSGGKRPAGNKRHFSDRPGKSNSRRRTY